jgi:hypothetical protein
LETIQIEIFFRKDITIDREIRLRASKASRTFNLRPRVEDVRLLMQP